ncbi:hypothetical protein FI667_g7996, partial [Globisporangium splendens]
MCGPRSSDTNCLVLATLPTRASSRNGQRVQRSGGRRPRARARGLGCGRCNRGRAERQAPGVATAEPRQDEPLPALQAREPEQVAAGRNHARRAIAAHATSPRVLAFRTSSSPQLATVEARSTMDDLINVLTQKEPMRKENLELRRQLESVHKLYETLRDICEQEKRLRSKDAATAQHHAHHHRGDVSIRTTQLDANRRLDARGSWMSFLDEEAPFFYAPYTEAECQAVLRETHEQISRLQTRYLNKIYQENVHIVKHFGWTANLMCEYDDELKVNIIVFTFKKTFRNASQSLSDLVASRWKSLLTPDSFRSFHRMPVKLKVLQTVNENMSVVMRNNPDPGESLRYRNVSLFSRSAYVNPQSKLCHMIDITGIPFKVLDQEIGGSEANSNVEKITTTTATTEKGEQILCLNGGILTALFSEGENDGDIDVELCGRTAILNEEMGQFLLVEISGSCIRIEHALFPFRLLT